MLDFVFIFLIFCEIFLTIFVVKKSLELEKRVILINEKLNEFYEIFTIANKKVYSTTRKVNKILSFLTNKKFIQIKKIILFTIEIIQITLLLKSFNFSKGAKFNFKNLKKLLLAQATKNFIERILISFNKCFVN